MSYSLYFIIRQIAMGLLFYLGLHMIFIPLPTQVRNSFYQQSLRMMGVAFLIVPLSCFLYNPNYDFILDLDLNPYTSAAVNLTAYFATCILMVLSFLILLGKRFNNFVFKISVATIIVFPMPLWLSLMSGRSELIDTVMTASYSYFVIAITLLDINVLRNCRKAIKNIDNFYADDVQICVNWIEKSMWLLIGLSINCAIAPILPISPRWLRLIFLVYGGVCYLHIHYGYRRMLFSLIEYFMLQDHSISDFVTIEQNEPNMTPSLSAAIIDKIQPQLTVWLSSKEYLHKGLTINTVAKSMGTNRTYLSKYINTTYQCSFKSWITQLRIEEAERLLSLDTELTINSIAERCGFASMESFTHTFTRTNGLSPSKWRDERSC